MNAQKIDNPSLPWWNSSGEEPIEQQWRLEVFESMIERERSVVGAHVVALATAGGVLFLVSNPLAVAAALLFRMASLWLTRWRSKKLHDALTSDQDITACVKWLCVALGIAGASWAGLILSIDYRTDHQAAQLAMEGLTLLGATLVIITFGPIKVGMITFAASFLTTAIVGNILLGTPMPIAVPLALIPLIAGAVIYSLGLASNAEAEAKLTLDNRKLSARLLVALEKAQYLACHDPMTGLANRRAFFTDYDVDLEPGHVRSFLLIDLDDFKSINDRFGHDQGDMVLRAVSMELEKSRKALPPGNHCCVRLGGDEFVLVLDRIDRTAAQAIAELLRTRIKQIPTRFNLDSQIRVSSSIGIALQEPGESLARALKRSDEAMYRSKDQGRNQVTIAA